MIKASFKVCGIWLQEPGVERAGGHNAEKWQCFDRRTVSNIKDDDDDFEFHGFTAADIEEEPELRDC